MSDHSEWLEHPQTVLYRKGLRDKARAIRYQAYLHLEVSSDDRAYLRSIEDQIEALDAGPVIEDAETIAKEAKRDGFDI